MALYTYVKSSYSRKKAILSAISIGCIFLGIGMLTWVVYPILAFEIAYAGKFQQLVRPVPKDDTSSFASHVASVLSSSTTDFTKASVWFPQTVSIRLASTGNSYTLSIPKLNISDAEVRIGTEDLDKSLIHYTGPMPGQQGNPIIFGHSTIPWLYNPKDYHTIFTKLAEVDEGDPILITSDQVTYEYRVTSMEVVKPNDVSVLEQRYDGQYLTVVTCTPPGTYLYRLVVRAKLRPLS